MTPTCLVSTFVMAKALDDAALSKLEEDCAKVVCNVDKRPGIVRPGWLDSGGRSSESRL